MWKKWPNFEFKIDFNKVPNVQMNHYSPQIEDSIHPEQDPVGIFLESFTGPLIIAFNWVIKNIFKDRNNFFTSS